jgi:GH15 family glucan-1,4-alpha-glucosidase
MYKKISDYGVIGNSRTLALVGNDGSMDWLCLPFMDSPSVFAALLDEKKGGYFRVQPQGDWDSAVSYLPGTNVLQTIFRTRQGVVKLIDFMPMEKWQDQDGCEGCTIYRYVEAIDGEVAIESIFAPRFDYARARTFLEVKDGVVTAEGAQEALVLRISHGHWIIQDDFARAVCSLKKDQCLWLCLHHGSGGQDLYLPERAEKALAETKKYWREWLGKNETGRDIDFGYFQAMVDRSALVLKLLHFEPTGAIAAAATTSLPEVIGGVRNWDYRFSWIRDSALTVEALYNAGHLSEMESYLHWMVKVIRHSTSDLQILYGLREGAILIEEELSHLEGYKGSAPVRIGNGAYDQKQLDIYGEIMETALRLSNYVGKIDHTLWPFLQNICDTVVREWQSKDSGIWEVRDGPYHFVYSKIMCWTALDRGITIADRYGFPANVAVWKEHRQRIRAEVLEKGWSASKQAFVQHYDSDALDASNLLIPFYRFLPYNDPRMIATVEAIHRELTDAEGLVYRYIAEDGLPGNEGVFLVCTFWLVDNLIGQHRFDEAQSLLFRLSQKANHLGLFAEEYDTCWQEALGNFPQAFTHIGYLNSVAMLAKTKNRLESTVREKTFCEKVEQKVCVIHKYHLNHGHVSGELNSSDIIKDMKHLMNILRGAYFRTAEGRVAYEEMAESRVYKEYLKCSVYLDRFELSSLSTREEQLAFWINLFNVLVIHGVIALGIRNSVKELPRFFRRVQYRVNGLYFSPDDIEHGILRSNHRLPHSVFKSFASGDPRRKFVVEDVDPRIHFALVCASSSCPPIDFYTAERLDAELTVSGKTFLNGGGIQVYQKRECVRLSRVFKWYGEDFGHNDTDRLRFIAPYLYEEKNKLFLQEKADSIQVEYQSYDWRLNRT